MTMIPPGAGAGGKTRAGRVAGWAAVHRGPGAAFGAARPWWMEQPPGRMVAAVSDGVIVGSAKMGPNRPGRGSHVTTASFLVDPARQGQGIGRALGEYVLDWCRSAGFASIQFNAVVEVPARSRAEFENVGRAHKFALAHHHHSSFHCTGV